MGCSILRYIPPKHILPPYFKGDPIAIDPSVIGCESFDAPVGVENHHDCGLSWKDVEDQQKCGEPSEFL